MRDIPFPTFSAGSAKETDKVREIPSLHRLAERGHHAVYVNAREELALDKPRLLLEIELTLCVGKGQQPEKAPTCSEERTYMESREGRRQGGRKETSLSSYLWVCLTPSLPTQYT